MTWLEAKGEVRQSQSASFSFDRLLTSAVAGADEASKGSSKSSTIFQTSVPQCQQTSKINPLSAQKI